MRESYVYSRFWSISVRGAPRCSGACQSPHRAENLLQGGELVHYLVGAQARRLLDTRGVQSRAQDQHPHLRIGPSKVGDQIFPMPVRKAQVQDHDVQLEPRGLCTGLGKRSCLRYKLDVRLAIQKDLHEGPEVCMILDKHDANLLCHSLSCHPCPPSASGIRNRTLVPHSFSLSISKSPPITAARSRMLLKPTPGSVSGPNPTPSSATAAIRSGPSIPRLTEILFALACLRALVRASCIKRDACVPVSPKGVAGTRSPTSRLISTCYAIVRFRLTRDSTISVKGRPSSSSMRRSLTTSRSPSAPRRTASIAACSCSFSPASSAWSMSRPMAADV